MRLIKQSTYKLMEWKNRLGMTSEIAIYPEGSVFSDNNFLWRISSAQIRAPSDFSNFGGYDRILVACKGEGLLLNKIKLEPLVPIKFPGEQKINCELVSDNVVDFGIIYKRELISAEMSVKTYSALELPSTLLVKEGTHFLFCVSGNCRVNQLKIETMDTLKVQGPIELQLEPIEFSQPFVFVQVIINHAPFKFCHHS